MKVVGSKVATGACQTMDEFVAKAAPVVKAAVEDAQAKAKAKAEVEAAKAKAKAEKDAARAKAKAEVEAAQAKVKAEKDAAKAAQVKARAEAREKRDAERAALKAEREAARQPKPCACGCGGLTKGRYLPGHDSRHHAWMVRTLESKDVPAIRAMLEKLGIRL